MYYTVLIDTEIFYNQFNAVCICTNWNYTHKLISTLYNYTSIVY